MTCYSVRPKENFSFLELEILAVETVNQNLRVEESMIQIGNSFHIQADSWTSIKVQTQKYNIEYSKIEECWRSDTFQIQPNAN